jgi:hypothetical protein
MIFNEKSGESGWFSISGSLRREQKRELIRLKDD